MIGKAIALNLEKAETLLRHISNDIYTDTSLPPYYSSIGGHIRHILDVFDCASMVQKGGEVNLIARERDARIETDKTFALTQIKRVKEAILILAESDLDQIVAVTDDHGCGAETINYTVGALLAQAQSHAIHHYALIGFMLNSLGIQVEDKTFGYNPTTPRQDVQAS